MVMNAQYNNGSIQNACVFFIIISSLTSCVFVSELFLALQQPHKGLIHFNWLTHDF